MSNLVPGSPEAIAADISANLISRVWDAGTKATTKHASKFVDELKVIYDTCFKPFVAAQYFQYFEIKTLVNPFKPVPVEEIFESPYLSINKKRKRYPSEKGISVDEFSGQVNERSRFIISAIAGSGKSVLLKYLFVRMVKEGSKFIPIFLELRHLNDLSEQNLETLIYAQINAANPKFKREQFLSALKLGKFCFMFDGYDELRPELRERIKAQANALSLNYPDNAMIITSRPDDEFLSWTKYTEYTVHPLDQDQVVSLLNKMPFDQKVKAKLITRIKDGLYSTHKDFLSNPLLAGMMLLTFESSYDIPTKRHIFFQRAFQALMEKHDASKGYKRSFRTRLDQAEFTKAFAAYCIYSYLEKEYSFSIESANQYAEFAFQMIGHSQSGSDFIHDLEKCVCMLVRDGDRLSFLHRSFQEYFSASFIVYYSQGKGPEILSKCIERAGLPTPAAHLCYDIDRDFVEFEYLLPLLDQFESDFRQREEDWKSVASLFFTAISKNEENTNMPIFEKKFQYVCWLGGAKGAPYTHLLLLLRRSKNGEVGDHKLIPETWGLVLGDLHFQADAKQNRKSSAFVDGVALKKGVLNLAQNLLAIRDEIRDRQGEKNNLLNLLAVRPSKTSQ